MAYEKKGYIEENYHFFHLKDCEGQELDYHFHEFDKLVILLSGNVVYSLEHEDYTLQPWDVFLVPHHTIHKAQIDRSLPYERIIIYFNRSYLRSLLPSADVMHCFHRAQREGRYCLHPNHDQQKKLEQIFDEYEQCIGENAFGAEAYRDTLMLQLLIWICRLHTASTKEVMVEMDEKIRETLTYINEHVTQELSVELLAGHVHLSRSYFMHLFKEETGMTVHSTIQQKRLLYAARKIREGIPVNIAVLESGFTDYSTFYRSFKATFGISPSDIKG